MIIEVFKKAGSDIWEEAFYLIIFNVIWVIGTLPALFLINISIVSNSLLAMALTAILFLPWALLTFGLFYTVNDISESKVIKFLTIFRYMHQTWRLAMVWGIINIVVVLLMVLNLGFYSRFEAQWAGILQMAFLVLLLAWISLQLIILPLYPRLNDPSFRLAFRNAAAIYGRYPLHILLLTFIVVVLGLLTWQFPVLGLFFTLAIIAVFANRMVDAIVKKEIDKQDEAS